MAISDRTRKILWQRSGNRCAVCRCELAMDSAAINSEAIAGYEFLIDEDTTFESHSPLTVGATNLLLLCPTHHTAIRSQSENYPIERLREIKQLHEAWVQEALQVELKASDHEPFMLYRVQTGKYLISMLHDSHASIFNHDSLKQGYETELVNGFFRLVQDHINLWDQLESRDQVQAETHLDKAIWQLETNGFLVYGCQRQEPYQMADVVMENWCMAYLLVVRQSNPVAAKQQAAIEQRMGVKSPVDSPFTSFILVQPGH